MHRRIYIHTQVSIDVGEYMCNCVHTYVWTYTAIIKSSVEDPCIFGSNKKSSRWAFRNPNKQHVTNRYLHLTIIKCISARKFKVNWFGMHAAPSTDRRKKSARCCRLDTKKSTVAFRASKQERQGWGERPFLQPVSDKSTNRQHLAEESHGWHPGRILSHERIFSRNACMMVLEWQGWAYE